MTRPYQRQFRQLVLRETPHELTFGDRGELELARWWFSCSCGAARAYRRRGMRDRKAREHRERARRELRLLW